MARREVLTNQKHDSENGGPLIASDGPLSFAHLGGTMNQITVKISPTLTEEQQKDPRFKEALREATAFFNSPNRFTKKFRSLLCLHEAGHVVYARRAGCTNIRFHGPMMTWCPGCPLCAGNSPSVSKSSVSWTYPPNCDVTAALKAQIGGIVFREVLSDAPNDAAAISKDMDAARTWYQEKVGVNDNMFEFSVEIARQEIIKDLRSPEFQQLAWDTAREFEKEIFPAPKLTSAMLRAKRLKWTGI
jgi:hypothetical protein